MRLKIVLISVAVATAFAAVTSYAQQAQSERARNGVQQDGRYLVYMRGLT